VVTGERRALRSARERVVQTLWFEGIGLALVAPLYAWASGTPGGESLGLIAAVSVAVMAWAALYNTLFDRVEWRLTGRVASDRPHRWRTLHAIGLEVTSVVVTTPLIWALSDLGWWGALAADLGLAAAYAAYGYAYFWAYDKLRPVRCTAR
jgi:uncharacterized membrane protein